VIATLRLFADYHTHTRYSHGKGTIADNVAFARQRGLSEVAITDHGPASLLMSNLIRRTDWVQIRREIEVQNGIYRDIRILFGVEANIVSLDGDLDVPREVLSQMDIVLAGLHLFVVPASLRAGVSLIINNAWLSRLSRNLGRRARRDNTRAVIRAVRKNRIDIITHPGLQLSIDTRELARVCADHGTALEINTSHREVTTDFIQCAAEEGVRFAIGSDAHDPWRVGDLGQGLALAQAAGLRPDQVINAVKPGQAPRFQ